MRIKLALFAAAAMTAGAAQADSQSSNTSSNSSSNNGVVRERVVDSYCETNIADARSSAASTATTAATAGSARASGASIASNIIATATLATTIEAAPIGRLSLRHPRDSPVIPAKAEIPLLPSVRIQE